MKKKILLIPFLFGALFFFTQCDKAALDGEQDFDYDLKNGAVCSGSQELWAGAGQNDLSKGTLVGSVDWTVTGNILKVTYKTDAPWVMTNAHLWVGTNKKAVPKNAAPGLFPFKKQNFYGNLAEFEINLLDELGIDPGTKLYLAAHADVEGISGVEAIEGILPETALYSVVQPNGTISYFKTTIHGGPLDGVYNGWCIDSRGRINVGTQYLANVYSSLGVLPDELLDIFDSSVDNKLNKLNWIINYDFVGKESSAFGLFTRGDIQKALWFLLEEIPTNPGGEGPFNINRVNEILALAADHGDYIPGCGERLVLILYLEGIQTTIIDIPVPCGEGDETAWALGNYNFIKEKVAKKWGWIFDINCY